MTLLTLRAYRLLLSFELVMSRRNFAVVSGLVVPGDPGKSLLLLQPLAPEAGGNAFHTGGRQFASKNDPGWKTLARWVSGPPAK